ncbi:unnamed protein product [Diamesa serratosioi]
MAKYSAMMCLLVTILVQLADAKPAYQHLQPKAGYVPVYIRMGDEPLENINPNLAEAFGEHLLQARNIKEDFLPESAPLSAEVSEPSTTLTPSTKLMDEIKKAMDDLAAELPEEPKITPSTNGVTKLTKVEQQ